jgi:hypothetical protein
MIKIVQTGEVEPALTAMIEEQALRQVALVAMSEEPAADVNKLVQALRLKFAPYGIELDPTLPLASYALKQL